MFENLNRNADAYFEALGNICKTEHIHEYIQTTDRLEKNVEVCIYCGKIMDGRN